jgi:type I restriction enzyme S subunit
VKKEWQSKVVSEVAHHSLGKMLDKSKNRGEPKPYLRNLNVRWFGFDLTDMLQMRFLPEEAAKFTAVKGDVLVCEGGYPGRAAIWEEEEPIYFQKAIHRIRFHEPERNRWFVYYLHFLDLTGQLKSYCSGTGIQHFTGKSLARLPVPLPPLPEQRRIVAILDEAFEGIAAAKANAEKNLRNVKGIGESHLDALFREHGSGPTQLLKAIASTQYGYTESASAEAIGPRFLRITDIQSGNVDWETVPYCRIDAAELPNYLLRDGDIVFARTGATTGKSYLVRSPPQSVFASYLIRLRPTSFEVISDYLACFFMTTGYWEAIRAGSTGSAQGGFNATKLGCLQVPVPALAEQRRIVASAKRLADQSEKFVEKLSHKIKTLDELKASLLHQAFTGQL